MTRFKDRENNIVVPSTIKDYIFYSPVLDEDLLKIECSPSGDGDLVDLSLTLMKLKETDKLEYTMHGAIVSIQKEQILGGHFVVGVHELSNDNQMNTLSYNMLCDLIYSDIIQYRTM